MKGRIAAWKHAFEGDEQAVVPTLVNFAWNYAAYSSVIQLVRQAPEDADGTKHLNALVMDLLAGGYWGSSVLAIRRLVDKGHLQGRDGVISLRAIIRDVRACRNRLTRRVYVEDIAELPYNYEIIRERYWAYAMAQEGAFWVPQEYWYEPSEERHAQFDWLSGTTPATSTPDDLIQEVVFDRLEARLAGLDAVADHATVYFAHAATEASRQGRVLDHWGPNEAKEALKALAETAELVGRWFCFSGIGHLLPIPQGDQFRFLDQPMLVGAVEPLQEQWERFGKEVNSWPMIEDTHL